MFDMIYTQYLYLYNWSLTITMIFIWISLSFMDRVHLRERVRRIGLSQSHILEQLLINGFFYDKFRILCVRPLCAIFEMVTGFLEGIENLEAIVLIKESNDRTPSLGTTKLIEPNEEIIKKEIIKKEIDKNLTNDDVTKNTESNNKYNNRLINNRLTRINEKSTKGSSSGSGSGSGSGQDSDQGSEQESQEQGSTENTTEGSTENTIEGSTESSIESSIESSTESDSINRTRVTLSQSTESKNDTSIVLVNTKEENIKKQESQRSKSKNESEETEDSQQAEEIKKKVGSRKPIRLMRKSMRIKTSES